MTKNDKLTCKVVIALLCKAENSTTDCFAAQQVDLKVAPRFAV